MSDQVHSVFAEVCDLPSDERTVVLDRVCAGKREMRAEIEALLAAHDGVGTFLGQPTADFISADKVTITESVGSQIDRYKLLEEIGHGGFGVVYMAQQIEPVRRRVALKIIKLGMDTRQVVARFEAERQALAMMDHPNIARVMDGGATDTGRPYFVMELVRGDPITEYCDREKLPLKERLDLFLQVCNAIQHAHQKGIIHRDIKPSNVLVTISDGRPMAKVIDFGIAKATNSELTEKTIFTEFRQLIGTPQYMSPEQAERSGVDVDTRSDIYSLGVLLYEMLTGHTPLDPQKVRSAAWGELQRIIRDEEPARPSAYVTSLGVSGAEIAKRRSTELTRLEGILRRDLDWVVLKSLEKDRTRRYATANQLAEDIIRYLNDEPVSASPPSAGYKLRKFARRNKRFIGVAATILGVMLAGLIGTSVTSVWAMRERSKAVQAEKLAAEKAAEAAKQADRARRLAAVAGSPMPLFTGDELKRMADAWKADVQSMHDELGPEAVETVRAEAQYLTWLAYRGQQGDITQQFDDLLPRARKVLKPDDVTFLGLVNAATQKHLAKGATDPKHIAGLYRDVMKSMELIHGLETTTEIFPEFAGALAKAGENEEAAEAIRRYVSLKKEDPKTRGYETVRLNGGIAALADWGKDYPELYKQLLDYRDSIQPPTWQLTDKELAIDLQRLQGKWETRNTSEGEFEHLIREVSDNRLVGRKLDEVGKEIESGEGQIELSRQGKLTVMTIASSSQGVSPQEIVYRFDSADQCTMITGMVRGPDQLPEVHVRVWKRIGPPVELQTNSNGDEFDDSEHLWQGTLDANGTKLRLQFQAKADAEGMFSGEMISLDQGAIRIPITMFVIDGDRLHIQVSSVGGGIRWSSQREAHYGRWRVEAGR